MLRGRFSLYATCGLQLNLALLLNGDLRDLFVAALSVMPSCLQLRGMEGAGLLTTLAGGERLDYIVVGSGSTKRHVSVLNGDESSFSCLPACL